jgi:HK97 gp10 family phage protein
MIPNLKFEGAKELDEALQELEGAAAVKVVRDSLLESVDPVIQSAKGRVPVDRGDLQQSISAGTRLTKRQRALHQPIVSRKGVEVHVGPGISTNRRGVRHSHLVEFGTYKMAPRPFMRPAWLSNLEAVFNGLAQAMTRNLEAAAKRAAAKARKVKR